MPDRIQILLLTFFILFPAFNPESRVSVGFAQTGAQSELSAAGSSTGLVGTAAGSGQPGYGTLDTPVLMERYSPDPTPPDGFESLTLTDILNRACDCRRAQSCASFYWRSVRAASDWKYYRQLSEQLQSLAGMSDPLALLYIRKTADRTAEARLRMRRRAIDLTASAGACNMPSNKLAYGIELPHIGQYQTNLGQIARYRGISPEISLLDKQIALDFEQIKAAASALAASMYYSEALWELLKQGKTTMAELVAGLEQEDKCREDFWDGIIRYNDDITAFALWSSQFQPYKGESLAKLLLLNPQPARLPASVSGGNASSSASGTQYSVLENNPNSTYRSPDPAANQMGAGSSKALQNQQTYNSSGQYGNESANNAALNNNAAASQYSDPGQYNNSGAQYSNLSGNQYDNSGAQYNNQSGNGNAGALPGFDNSAAGASSVPNAASQLPSGQLPASQGLPQDLPQSMPETSLPVAPLPQPSDVPAAPSLDVSQSRAVYPPTPTLTPTPTPTPTSAYAAGNANSFAAANPIRQTGFESDGSFASNAAFPASYTNSGADSRADVRDSASGVADLNFSIPEPESASRVSDDTDAVPLVPPTQTHQTYYTPQMGQLIQTSNTAPAVGAESPINWFDSAPFKRAGDKPCNLKEYLSQVLGSQHQNALGDYWRATVERQRLAAAYTALRRAEAIQNQMLPQIQSLNNSVQTSMFYLAFNTWKQTLLAETAKAEGNLIFYQFRMARWMNCASAFRTQNSLPWPTTPFQTEAYRISSENLSKLTDKDQTLAQLTGSVALEYEQSLRSRKTLAQAQNLVRQAAASGSVRSVVQMLRLEYQTAVDQLEQTAQYNFTVASYVHRWGYVRQKNMTLNDYCNSLVSRI